MSGETETAGETPMTDAAKWISQYGRVECFVVEADFARTLEREWIGMKSEVQVCHQKIERLERENAALRAELAEAERKRDIAASETRELRRLHDAGCREAYRICGTEDDGEYRWKWVLLGMAGLKQRADSAERQLAEALNLERARLEHWAEYWNGNRNERAMSDALGHILGQVEARLMELSAIRALNEGGNHG